MAGENVEKALEILFYKYYNIDPQDRPEDVPTRNELNEMKNDEKSVLESIYDSSFQIKESNVWSVKIELDYLTKLYLKPEVKRKENINYNNKNSNYKTKKKDLCKLFLKGPCRFGDKCRFLHENPKENVTIEKVVDSDPIKFELEIRFPNETVYPYQVPLLFFKPLGQIDTIPQLIFFKITARLIEEAKTLAQDGIPSIYSLVELLKNEEEIVNFIKFDTRIFPDPSDLLFPQLIENNDIVKQDLPSHYKKGAIRNTSANVNFTQLIKENKEIAKRWQDKTGNESYNKMMATRRKLPAWQKRNDILNIIEKSQV